MMGYKCFYYIFFNIIFSTAASGSGAYPPLREWQFTTENEKVITGNVYTDPQCSRDDIYPQRVRDDSSCENSDNVYTDRQCHTGFRWANITEDITADSIFHEDYGMTAVMGIFRNRLSRDTYLWMCKVNAPKLRNMNFHNLNYTTEVGQLSDNTGESYTAFRVSPPALTNTYHHWGSMGLYLSFPHAGDWAIYSFDDVKFNSTGIVHVSEGKTMVSVNITIDFLTKKMIFFGLPANMSQPNIFKKLAEGINGGIVYSDDIFTVSATTYSVMNVNQPAGYVFPSNELRTEGYPAKPTDGKRHDDFNFSPSDQEYRYGALKRFFQVYNNGVEGVVWQDVDTWYIFVTWFHSVDGEYETIRLPSPYYKSQLGSGNESFAGYPFLLSAAAGNEGGHIAYIMISIVGKLEETEIRGFKADANGNVLNEVKYNSRTELYMSSYFHSGAVLKWNLETGQLLFIISKFQPTAPDGGKHIDCSANLLNAYDMSYIKGFGSLASHCWGHSLTVDNGKFLSAVIGDAQPRAIKISEFYTTASQPYKKDKLVYNFKTRHYTESKQTRFGRDTYYSYYPEISGDISYYKGSNDNDVYTEMAQNTPIPVDDDNALLIIFAGEAPALDLTNVGQPLNAPRNLGFVKVVRDFDDDTVLSDGPTVEADFYDMHRQLHHQINKGINWITNWKNKMEDNVSRLKALKLWKTNGNENILVLFERWTAKDYKCTELMIINQNGETIVPMRCSDYDFRLLWADEIYLSQSNTVVFYAGELGLLTRYEIELNLGPTPPPTPRPTRFPTKSPTGSPTKSPTRYPTRSPTRSPTPPTTLPPTGAKKCFQDKWTGAPCIWPVAARAPPHWSYKIWEGDECFPINGFNGEYCATEAVNMGSYFWPQNIGLCEECTSFLDKGTSKYEISEIRRANKLFSFNGTEPLNRAEVEKLKARSYLDISPIKSFPNKINHIHRRHGYENVLSPRGWK